MWKRKVALLLSFILLLGISIGMARGVDAESDDRTFAQAGTFVTPTPGPDGRIVYYAQPEDDSFWTIAAKAGITLEQLYALNGIQDGDYLITGMELILGFAGPTEPTLPPEELISPTPVEPSPTPLFNTGEICVLLFLDENGNGRLEEEEGVIPGGQISIIDANGTLADEATTGEEVEGDCFQGLQAGDYNVSAAVPPEYNPTTTLNLPIRLQAGDIKYVQFGAQPSAALQDQAGGDLGDRSTWFGVFGVLMLLAAAGLAVYASRLGRRMSKLP